MDDQRRSAIRKDGVIVATQVDIRIGHRSFGRSIGGDSEIFHVSGMRSLGILQTVMFFVGIEVAAGGSESRRLALGVLMDVDSMFAGRKILQIQLDLDTVGLASAKRCDSDAFPLGVFQFDLGGSGKDRDRQRAKCGRC